MIQFYHPNKTNTGSGISFSFNSKESCVYLSLVKQTGTNENGNGTFKGGKNCNVKFNLHEIGDLIYCIEHNVEISLFHKSAASQTNIKFGPYFDQTKTIQRGYSLNIFSTSQEKTSFVFGFRFGEAEVFKQFLKTALVHCIEYNHREFIKHLAEKAEFKAKNASKNPPKDETSEYLGEDPPQEIDEEF